MNNQPDSWSEGSSYCRYDRSERLKRAPEAVQQMYEPDYIKKMSLIKSLTATRSSRSMLFAIVAVFALTFASFLLKTDRQSGKILGIPTKLEYLTQQDYLYVNISFGATEQHDDYVLPLTVRITAANRDTEQKETKTVEAIYIGSALSVPAQFPAHTYTQLEAVALAGGKALSLRSAVKK